LYESTPFRQRRDELGTEETFDFDTEIITPQQEMTGSENSMKIKQYDADDEVLNTDAINRDKVDTYIAGVNKWRKGKKRKSDGKYKSKKIKRKTQQNVRDCGVEGSITPNGSIKIKVSEQRFINDYDFTDEDEELDEDDY